jgi:hypothetical protein
MKASKRIITIVAIALAIGIPHFATADITGTFSGVVTSYTSDDGIGHPLLVGGVAPSLMAGTPFFCSFVIRDPVVFPYVNNPAELALSADSLNFGSLASQINTFSDSQIDILIFDFGPPPFDDYGNFGDISASLFLDLSSDSGSIDISGIGTVAAHPDMMASFDLAGNVTSIDVVPEGDTSWLLGLGLAGIALLRRTFGHVSAN